MRASAPEPALGEIVPTVASELAVRARRLRSIRGLRQDELARLAGVSQTVVSQLEQGKIEPGDEAVARVAHAFGVTTEFLEEPLGLAPMSRPWLRAYADASKREADARVAFASLAIEYVARLNLRPLEDRLPGAPVDADDDEQIEEVASDARLVLGLDDDQPIPNAVRAAERFGCVVLPMESELGRHLGMSIRANDIPVICVAKDGIPGDRQRFTVCHEIGHLILHGSLPPPATGDDANRMERQANKFAAALLTPGDAVLDTLDEFGGRVTLQNLAQVKAVWGVAIKSLVGRFRSLGRIDDEQARSLYKQISARRWTKAEPVDVPNEAAQWFAGSLTRKARTGTDLSEAARLLAPTIGGNAHDLMSFADWTPRPDADVVDISTRRH